MVRTILKHILFTLSIGLILSGCAASYNPINPSAISYAEIQTQDTSIVLHYQYNVLTTSDNKKYAKKEVKYNLNLVAIKITNNTLDTLYTDSLMYYNGNTVYKTANPKSTKKLLRQRSGCHLFYLLLSPVQFYDGKGSNPTPIGIFIGPALAIGNMTLALSANKAFMNDLTQYSVKNKKILPNESLYALMGIRNKVGDPIYVKVKK